MCVCPCVRVVCTCVCAHTWAKHSWCYKCGNSLYGIWGMPGGSMVKLSKKIFLKIFY